MASNRYRMGQVGRVIDELDADFEAHIANHPGGDASTADIVITPGVSHEDVEEQTWNQFASKGGSVHFSRGVHEWEGPVNLPPGNVYTVDGYQPKYHSGGATTFKAMQPRLLSDGSVNPDFIDPNGQPMAVINFTSKGKYDWSTTGSSREAWWGRQASDLHVDGNGKDIPAFRFVGGNLNRYVNLSAQDVPYGIIVEGDRPNEYDHQYSVVDGFWFRYTKKGVEFRKGSPDTTFRHGWVYGTHQRGQVGWDLWGSTTTTRSANNITLFDCHSQFTEIGYKFAGDGCLVIGGSWENKNGQPLISDDACAWLVKSSVSGLVVYGQDLANKSSVADLFHIEDGARKYRFRDLTGHIDASDLNNLTAAQKAHFDLIPD